MTNYYSPINYSPAPGDNAPIGAAKIDAGFANILSYPRVGIAYFEYLLSINGAVMTASATDDSAAIQAALNTYSRTQRGQAYFPPGLTTNIANPLLVTVGNQSFNGLGLTLNYTGTSGIGMEFVNASDAVSNFQSAMNPIENFQLVGPVAQILTSTITGVSVGGSNTTITDSTKNWAVYTAISGATIGAYVGVTWTHGPSGQTSVIIANTATTLTFANIVATINSGDAYSVAGNDAVATLPTADGLFFGALSGTKTVSDQMFRNIVVRNFRNGVLVGNQGFICYFSSCNIYNNWSSGIFGNGTVNSGENISFSQCNISANNVVSKHAVIGASLAISIPTGTDVEINTVNCSIDYNDQAFDVESGILTMAGGHMEDNHYGNPLGKVTYNGGIVTAARFVNPVITCTESAANARPYMFVRSNSSSFMSLTDPTFGLFNRATAVMFDTAGTGRGGIRGAYNILGSGATSWPTLGASFNRIYDPILASNSLTYWPQALGTQNAITALGSLVGGSGYTANLTASSRSLSGGTGTGATALFTTDGSGVVTVCTLGSGGANYTASDVLGVTGLGGGTGFSITATTVAGANSFSVVTSPTPPTGATFAAQMNGVTGNSLSMAQSGIALDGNSTVQYRAMVNVSAYTSGSVYILIRWYSSLGTVQLPNPSQSTNLVATTGGYQEQIIDVIAPAGASSCVFLFYGQNFIGTAQATLFVSEVR